MQGDAVGAREKSDEVLRHVERFDRADAEASKRCFIQDTAQKIENIRTRGKIAAPRAEIDPAENDFLKAGVTKSIDFRKDGFRREAAAFSADERNDTERAAVVAAVLNLESRTSVMRFSSEDGSDEDMMGGKDVACKNWRWANIRLSSTATAQLLVN